MTPVELLAPAETMPDNERWHELRRAGVTASEVAAILGISPWESAFSLYWRKVNDWRTDDNEFTSAGRHLEDAIARWWWGEHRNVYPLAWMAAAGLYAHPERPWQLATPDRLLGVIDDEPDALLECKWVAHSWDGWGDPGTDDIPVYYRAQVLWQADVLGVDEVHVAALGPGGFRAYVVRVDDAARADLKVMRAAGAAFMRQMQDGEVPDLDGHTATLTALRKLHPLVGDGDVEVPLRLAVEYREARDARAAAEAKVAHCEAEIRAALGSEFNRAVCNGKLVASRSVYDQSGDTAELTALEGDWPVVDRLNPGRSTSYA